MKVLKRTKAFEVRLYMGARKGYGEEQYPADKVVRAISEFQAGTEDDEPPIPVRLTSTTFVSPVTQLRGTRSGSRLIVKRAR